MYPKNVVESASLHYSTLQKDLVLKVICFELCKLQKFSTGLHNSSLKAISLVRILRDDVVNAFSLDQNVFIDPIDADYLVWDLEITLVDPFLRYLKPSDADLSALYQHYQ